MSHGARRQPRLDHVVVVVREWRGSEDFYRRVMRAVLESRGDRRASWFGGRQGDVRRRWGSLTRLTGVPRRPGGADLCLVRPDMTSPVHSGHGGVEVRLPRRRTVGDVSAWVRDPDGDLIELVSFRRDPR